MEKVLLDYPLGLTAGVDEAGRGPLAGPVFAAAVILNPSNKILGLNDSKKLSATKRQTLEKEIKEKALSFAVSFATVEEIDALNILNATFLAMRRAVLALSLSPERVLIDGNSVPPNFPFPAECLIKGDSQNAAIAAASILAKTARDFKMLELDKLFPQYGFAQHKGYGTALHLERLNTLGACAAHRKSFAPMKYFNKQQAFF